MLPRDEMPSSIGSGDIWLNGADGERHAIGVDSRDTHGAYSVIEAVAEPGCKSRRTVTATRKGTSW
jgi:hypothetical protein